MYIITPNSESEFRKWRYCYSGNLAWPWKPNVSIGKSTVKAGFPITRFHNQRIPVGVGSTCHLHPGPQHLSGTGKVDPGFSWNTEPQRKIRKSLSLNAVDLSKIHGPHSAWKMMGMYAIFQCSRNVAANDNQGHNLVVFHDENSCY